MRVVLLGHEGFVGSAIRDHLVSLGLDVIGVDRQNYASVRGTSADVVINANGSSDRRLARADPLRSFRANADTAFASIVDFPCRNYVLISSVEVYNDLADRRANSESAPIDPMALSPYGFIKYLTELIVSRLVDSWVILRLGGLVGPGLWKNAIYDLLAERRLFIHPESSVPFMDTRDVARVTWQLRDETRQIFNVCGDGGVRPLDVVRALNIDLPPSAYDLPLEIADVNIDKLRSRMPLRSSMSAVLAFAEEWRSGSLRARPQ